MHVGNGLTHGSRRRVDGSRDRSVDRGAWTRDERALDSAVLLPTPAVPVSPRGNQQMIPGGSLLQAPARALTRSRRSQMRPPEQVPPPHEDAVPTHNAAAWGDPGTEKGCWARARPLGARWGVSSQRRGSFSLCDAPAQQDTGHRRSRRGCVGTLRAVLQCVCESKAVL